MTILTELAPIALFTFKRPEHTRRTLESLSQNPEFDKSPLYVFCDGARRDSEREAVEASREVVRSWPHPNKIVVEAATNMGLASSVIAGVTRLCGEYGRVIVMEDDLLVSPVFLDYMNRALDRYRDDEQVFQITGHMWPVEVNTGADAFFMPLTNSLGWGTWNRAWKQFEAKAESWESIRSKLGERRRFDLGGRFPFAAMLEKSLRGQVDSWAILWYLTVFSRKGLVLHPRRSLLVNVGFDGVGTHSISSDQQRYGEEISAERIDSLPKVEVDLSAFERVCIYLSEDGSHLNRMLRWIKSHFPVFAN